MDMDESSNLSTGSENEQNYSSTSVAAKLTNGELGVKDVRKKSKVWDIFSRVINQRGTVVENFVCCKVCKKILKYTNKSTSNLTKHKCYVLRPRSDTEGNKIEVDDATKRELMKIMSKWVIRSCRPFNLVEDDGLREILIKFLIIGSRYGPNLDIKKALPHPTTLASSISHLYEQNLQKVKNELLSIQENGFGLTTDIWTDEFSKENYMSLTIHFLKDAVLTVRLLGMIAIKGENCTTDNIQSQIRTLLQDFGYDISFKTLIVTGRGLSITQPFQTNLHLSCICHLLHNTVTKSIEEVPEVAQLIESCSNLMNYFQESGLYASLSTLTLSSCCENRWNTKFYMLKSVEENWSEIYQTLHSRNEFNRLNSIKIDDIKAVVKILATFEEATKAFEVENNATMHLVLIYLYKLKTVCTSNDSNTDLTQQLTEKLLFYLNSLVTPNIKVFHKIAVFLFPPFNKLVQFSEVEKEFVYEECIRLLECFQNQIPTVKEEVADVDSHLLNRKDDLFSAFLPQEDYNNPNVSIRQELLLYRNNNVAYSDNFNVFSWWEFHKNQFPYLYKLSCMVLSTPASCTSSERIFSSARNVLYEKWSSLYSSGVAIKQIMFLHTNLDKNEILDNELWANFQNEKKEIN